MSNQVPGSGPGAAGDSSNWEKFKQGALWAWPWAVSVLLGFVFSTGIAYSQLSDIKGTLKDQTDTLIQLREQVAAMKITMSVQDKTLADQEARLRAVEKGVVVFPKK